MDREELKSLIFKFHQKSIDDLELARLKMFISQPGAQEMMENMNFPDFPQQAEKSDLAGMYAAVHRRISALDTHKTARFRNLWITASAAAVLFIVSLIVWQWSKPSSKPVQWAEIVTTAGERKKITLPDGSIAYLNAASRLSYPEKYPDTLRTVHLQGEAFFEVSHSASKPFMVHTAYTTTRVLGTRFNVEAREREGVTRIALVEGKVVTGDSINKTMLIPGNMMLYQNVTGRQSIVPMEGDVSAWIKGELIFNGLSLKEALQRISEAYNIQIIIDPDISQSYTVTGHFEKGSPEHILDALLAIYGFKWKKVSEVYRIHQ